VIIAGLSSAPVAALHLGCPHPHPALEPRPSAAAGVFRAPLLLPTTSQQASLLSICVGGAGLMLKKPECRVRKVSAVSRRPRLRATLVRRVAQKETQWPRALVVLAHHCFRTGRRTCTADHHHRRHPRTLAMRQAEATHPRGVQAKMLDDALARGWKTRACPAWGAQQPVQISSLQQQMQVLILPSQQQTLQWRVWLLSPPVRQLLVACADQSTRAQPHPEPQ
jgi:hypothetical protein